MRENARTVPPENAPLNIIVVEDSELDYELLLAMLLREGMRPRTTRVEDEAGVLQQRVEFGAIERHLDLSRVAAFREWQDDQRRQVRDALPDAMRRTVNGGGA